MEYESNLVVEEVNHHIEVRRLFAEKLIKAMVEHGHYPAKPNGKADASKLAAVAGVSRQMAYKYLNGEAIPSTTVLEKISGWLGYPAKWLINCESDNFNLKTKHIDEPLCKAIFNMMENQFTANKLSHDKFSSLVDVFLQIYNYAAATGSDLESKIKSAEQMITLIKKQPLNM